ncbi:hypothetical protein X801_05294, partial [Opisthorchis viverrini]
TVSLKSKLLDAESVIHEKDVLLADRDSVLAAATYERTALSQAVDQNRTLKQQLDELQDAFQCARWESECNDLSEAFEALSRELDRAREHGEYDHATHTTLHLEAVQQQQQQQSDGLATGNNDGLVRQFMKELENSH